ncbi:cupin domain-containing protein [Gluconobacter thailandicus]|uniref:Cupin domain-containing protein n=1 Tax=Gluconobacter thailandicus TaxID=257438 RepID=A0AAP9EU67_GLUTH|nr:cupin domain-containing protein [Gluconobacter thailandicus]QEH97794.1 cupin domain-containing protein [Gluconobacter thailandicus]
MAHQTKFGSGDFGKTPSRIQVQMPERLSHPDVEQANANPDFSVERKHPVHIVNLPSHALSMTIGGLIPGGRSGRHRHTYETILYVLEGRGYSIIEDRRIDWSAGDALYIPVWAWHHHVNSDPDKPARYLACENAPMLQNAGGLAIREEAL